MEKDMIKDYRYQFEIDENGNIKIIGMPFQTKYVELPRTERYRKIYSHTLSDIDLKRAMDYLERAVQKKDLIIREGLFKMAVITYAKCFLPSKNGGRSQLEASKIYKDVDGDPIKCHEKFVHMRHKYLAHDELDYKEAQVGLVLDIDSRRKVGIANVEKQTKLDYDESINILYTLCKIACNKVENMLKEERTEAEQLFDAVDFADLEQYPEMRIQIEEKEYLT